MQSENILRDLIWNLPGFACLFSVVIESVKLLTQKTASDSNQWLLRNSRKRVIFATFWELPKMSQKMTRFRLFLNNHWLESLAVFCVSNFTLSMTTENRQGLNPVVVLPAQVEISPSRSSLKRIAPSFRP